VKPVFRTFLFVLLLAALPLRGTAGVLMALCEGHHGGAAAAHEHAHEHGDDHQHEADDGGAGNPTHAASVCSVCAACCAGAGLATQLIQEIVFQPPGTIRIPFFDHRFSVFVPEHLDRPPLAS
jgi:hypothetical protein